MSSLSTIKSNLLKQINAEVSATNRNVYGPDSIVTSGSAVIRSLNPDAYKNVITGSLCKGTGIPAKATVTKNTNSKLTLSTTASATNSQTVTLGAGVTAADTSITVTALTAKLLKGTILPFIGTGNVNGTLVVTADAAAGATTVSVTSAPAAIANSITCVAVGTSDIQFIPVLGTGDGTVKLFTGTLSQGSGAITPGSVSVKSTDTVTETHSDTGGLGVLYNVATGVASGTINYKTGAISVTFIIAPANTEKVIVYYTDGETSARKVVYNQPLGTPKSATVGLTENLTGFKYEVRLDIERIKPEQV